MATPIKITPTLKNSSSAKFNQQLDADKSKKIPQADKTRILSLVNEILSKNKATK